MRAICLLILLAIITAVAIFAVQNNENVVINFLDRTISSPMAQLVIVVYVLGMLSGWSFVGVLKRTLQRVTQRPDTRSY